MKIGLVFEILIYSFLNLFRPLQNNFLTLAARSFLTKKYQPNGNSKWKKTITGYQGRNC